MRRKPVLIWASGRRKISPCVLAMVTKGDEILLARNNLFPEGLFSILAGFVEVSESAEETVKREVLEEVNLHVKNIKYHGSQPWPFPSQLMLGFSCEYESGEIILDKKEIAEAKIQADLLKGRSR